MIALASIFIIIAGSTLILAIVASTCCRKIVRRPERDYTKRDRLISIVSVAVVIFLLTITAITGFTANSQISKTITRIRPTGEQLIANVTKLRKRSEEVQRNLRKRSDILTQNGLVSESKMQDAFSIKAEAMRVLQDQNEWGKRLESLFESIKSLADQYDSCYRIFDSSRYTIVWKLIEPADTQILRMRQLATDYQTGSSPSFITVQPSMT